MITVSPAGPLRGSVQVPGDKSVSHRAVLFGALARGVTRATGVLRSEDVERTITAVRLLGAEVDANGTDVTVRGVARPRADLGTVDCGNSGTTARLLLGAFAPRTRAMFDGDASLRRRPMGRVLRPLGAMGANFEGGPTLPLTVLPRPLHGIRWTAEVASAQVKSAVLLAGLCAEGPTTYVEPVGTRDHTERMLARMGADIEVSDGIVGVRRSLLQGAEVRVPADVSSAAFWLVAASIVPGSDLVLRGVGVNPTRTGVLDVLLRMGAQIEVLAEDGASEPIATLRVRCAGLRGTSVGGAEVPRLVDEIPVLAVAAAFAEGETRFTGAEELRVKESDRIATTVAGLRAIGVDADPLPDGLVVRGAGMAGPALHAAAAVVESHGDHRIAMAFAVAGLRTGVVLSDTDCIQTSYPAFLPTLAELARA